MLAAAVSTANEALAPAIKENACECYRVIQPQHPHQCQLCHRKISACLYTNNLQHKITLQAYEINELKKELHACELEKRKQDLDFQTLHSKYSAILDTMSEVQYQKEQADRELEDLSARLFEEANNMVASEKKKRVQLQNKLELTEDQLVNERTQLQELKSRMESLNRINRASSYFDSESEGEETEKARDVLSIENSNHSSFFYYTRPQIVLPPAQQSEYITQCEKEDIEPCLGFGNPESRMCVKVMMEYMLHKPCFIEHITLDVAKSIASPINATSSAYYRPLWERWSELECASCGRKTSLKQPFAQKFYRFRLVEEDDWLLIDHDCRNRLVAVCDFYSFIRNIQLGLYQNRSLHDLYQENVQLRLKMFYSRYVYRKGHDTNDI
ncbi:hypothetical protein FB192DRAFT_1278201 [Mucor lusitanicus]|uniref:GDP/GTP exchange factor Sec2 N-terminal domain-containing protein n=1 Tax=Mucor circinelloides f. lusitanicus TaxID=29924 RepID=A0A8H4BLB3_MUCCL|nr:hypothetical protein FB192DRAFT_1278201 [Mucor lusitanicus]